uniref:Uncharacterized protein n=1 Tax=Lepeophtheirus salmonis TaxID=72036 RepID=A0A0K2U693_LEPSM
MTGSFFMAEKLNLEHKTGGTKCNLAFTLYGRFSLKGIWGTTSIGVKVFATIVLPEAVIFT